jgi:hypothetical protein
MLQYVRSVKVLRLDPVVPEVALSPSSKMTERPSDPFWKK